MIRLLKRVVETIQGKPVQKKYGVPGVYLVSGAPTGEEFIEELRPPEGLLIYRKMRWNDPVIGGVMLQLESVLARLKWNVVGGSDGARELVDKMLSSIPKLVWDMASAFTYGFYVGELIWEVGDYVRLVDVEPRSQLTIIGFDFDRGVVRQRTPGGEEFEIPYAKVVHFVPVSEGRNPYGRSFLRHVYKPFYYKTAIEAAEAIGIDRDLSGLPVLRAPQGFDFNAADPSSPNYDPLVHATLQWATQLVTNIRRDKQKGVVLPFGWELTLLRGTSTASIDTDRIVRRYNTEICVALLENFLTGGTFSSTNQANVEMQVQNFLYACNSWAAIVADCINRQIVAKICEYNGIPEEERPRVVPSRANMINLRDLASYIARLVAQGVIEPTKPLEEALLAVVDLPFVEEGDEQQR